MTRKVEGCLEAGRSIVPRTTGRFDSALKHKKVEFES